MKRGLIDWDHKRLSIRRQCELLGLNRSTLYYRGVGESEENLKLMRLIDEQYLRKPFYGSRKMTLWLISKKHKVNRKRGYAPNYTPTATTDGERGFIVDVDVLSVVNEGEAAAASVDRIEETFGKKPEKFLTDAGNNSGQIMAEMEERGVEFYAPVESNQPEEGSPAKRDDPR